MIKAAAFLEPLRALTYSPFAGVPCSFLNPFINYGIAEPRLGNESHDSTGGPQSSSSITRFDDMAAAANYRCAFAANRREEILELVKILRRHPRPSLLHVQIRPGSSKDLSRPTIKPREVKDRFMEFFARTTAFQSNKMTGVRFH